MHSKKNSHAQSWNTQVACDLLNVFAWSVSVRRAWLLVHYVAFECDIRSCTYLYHQASCMGESRFFFIIQRKQFWNHHFLAWRDTESSVRNVYRNATSCDVWTYRLSGNKISKRKVFLGKLQLEHILVYFHNPFQLIVELEKKSNLVTRAFSAKSYTRDTDSLHSCTRLRLVQEMACLNHWCKILAEKALVPKLDSYSNAIPCRFSELNLLSVPVGRA